MLVISAGESQNDNVQSSTTQQGLRCTFENTSDKGSFRFKHIRIKRDRPVLFCDTKSPLSISSFSSIDIALFCWNQGDGHVLLQVARQVSQSKRINPSLESLWVCGGTQRFPPPYSRLYMFGPPRPRFLGGSERGRMTFGSSGISYCGKADDTWWHFLSGGTGGDFQVFLQWLTVVMISVTSWNTDTHCNSKRSLTTVEKVALFFPTKTSCQFCRMNSWG